ncbi:MAG: DUF1844 domain-containing protein [Candidatus Riflebacteria bacterium]|nr:DUF1844 domain-containing protein [Candidatus Riflebacteria bacterium]
MKEGTPAEAQKQELQFLALVEMLTGGAMSAMGKIANPATGEEEVDLDQARLMIDLLEMLEAKTRGNLSDREKRMLGAQLTNLRLTFVDEVERQKQKPDQKPGPEPAPERPAQAPEGKATSEAPRPQVKQEGFVDRRSGSDD